jgi:molybdopterin-synthase adenylyltransferase
MEQDRYDRLARYRPLALPRWRASCCAVIGLGGLGGGLASQLARLGVKRLTLIDRDTVSGENLGHQQLYTEHHAALGLPKAAAAAQVLSEINSQVELAPHAASLDRHNISSLLNGVELLFDGLDNYYSRLLLNDYALSAGKPYFYAGVVRGELAARAVIPGVSGCLRCLLPQPPPAGSVPTCAAEGVFPPLLAVANALQLDLASHYLSGNFTVADDALYSLTLPGWRWRCTPLLGPRAECPACGQRRYDYLSGELDALARQACSPDEAEVQLAPVADLSQLADRLASSGFALRANPFCITASGSGLRYTVFASGRIILTGSNEPEVLNRFVATYLGV